MKVQCQCVPDSVNEASCKFWHWFQSDVAHEGGGTFLRPICATFTQSGDIISQIHTSTIKRSPLARQKLNSCLILCAKLPAKQSHRCKGCDDRISLGMFAHLHDQCVDIHHVRPLSAAVTLPRLSTRRLTEELSP